MSGSQFTELKARRKVVGDLMSALHQSIRPIRPPCPSCVRAPSLLKEGKLLWLVFRLKFPLLNLGGALNAVESRWSESG